MEKVRKQIKANESFVVESNGISGGLAAFWYIEDVVKYVMATAFTIEIHRENK